MQDVARTRHSALFDVIAGHIEMRGSRRGLAQARLRTRTRGGEVSLMRPVARPTHTQHAS